MRRAVVVLVLVVGGLLVGISAVSASVLAPTVAAVELVPPVCPTDLPTGSTCVWILNPEPSDSPPPPEPVDTSTADAVGALRATVTAGFVLVLFVAGAALVGWWRRRV